MSLSDGLNYFEYLLLKSLCVVQHKLVTRSFLIDLISNLTNWSCGCNYCYKVSLIKLELEKNHFDTTNKNSEWWRITEKWGEITVVHEPESERTE